MSAEMPTVSEVFFDPRRAFAKIRSLNLGANHLFMGVFAAVLFSTISVNLVLSVADLPEGSSVQKPVTMAVQNIVMLGVLTVIFTFAGRYTQGSARLADMAIALAMNSVATVPVQAIIMLSATFVPSLAPAAVAGALGYGIWHLSAAVAEAHGFEQTRKGFFVVILTVIALSFVLALLIGFFQPALLGG